MSDPTTAMRMPPTVEDLEIALVHSLAMFGEATDALRMAGFAVTHPSIGRRDRLAAIRQAMIATRQAEYRLPLLHDELTTLLRRLDPLSDMLPEAQPQ
jgi:hypothetical protein